MKRAQELTQRLTCDDPAAQYEALRSIGRSADRSLFLFVPFVDAVRKLAAPGNPGHIRRQAVGVLGYADDENFAEYLYPFLRDEDPAVGSKAIASLASLDARAYGGEVVEILSTTPNPTIRGACFEYLAKVSVYDEATVLTIVDLLQSLAEEKRDIGTQVRMAKVLGKQWSGFRDCALEALLPFLESENSHVRRTALSASKEEIADSHVSSPALRRKLAQAIHQASAKGTDIELAEAWVCGLLSDKIDRSAVWKAILDADETAVDAFIRELDNDYVERLFDSADDVDALQKLLSKHQNLKDRICDILAQVGSAEALTALASRSYKPEGWQALGILRGITQLKEWSEEFRGLLDSALAAEKPYGADYRKAFGLFANYKAGDIDLEQLLSDFPKLSRESFWGEEYFRKSLRELLQEAKAGSTPRQRGRLSQLMRRLK